MFSVPTDIRSIFTMFRWTSCRLFPTTWSTLLPITCSHYVFSWTPTCATLICTFKQSKGKGFYVSRRKRVHRKASLTNTHSICSAFKSLQQIPLTPNQPNTSLIGQFWRRCFWNKHANLAQPPLFTLTLSPSLFSHIHISTLQVFPMRTGQTKPLQRAVCNKAHSSSCSALY